MRVTDLRQTNHDGQLRLSARLEWEDRERAPATLWYDFPQSLGNELTASANVMLAPALGAALRDGEKRISIDGPVCPRLFEGLEVSAELIASWFEHVNAPKIETRGFVAPHPKGTRAAICLSGGVDSLAALQANRAQVPSNHPDHVRDGIFYFGLNTFDFDGDTPRPERLAAFAQNRARLEAFGERVGVRVIPLATNVRTFASSWEDWDIGGLTPALVAGAHALSQRIRSLIISGAGNSIYPVRHGSHPLLDAHFSSFALDVRCVHAMLTRVEKVRLLAKWPEALDALHVCLLFDVPEGAPNCGKCEKCVRTMIELLLAGVLDRASTFPTRDVTPEMIRGIDSTVVNPLFYTRCRDGLQRLGRSDLVAAINDRLAAEQKHRGVPSGARDLLERPRSRSLTLLGRTKALVSRLLGR